MFVWSFSHHPLPVLLLILSGGSAVYHGLMRSRVPDVPWYLLLGILFGPVGHMVRVGMNTASFSSMLDMSALFVLFEGGRGLPLAQLKSVWTSVAALASMGVLITVTAMALAVHFVLGIPTPLAILLGVLLANTDPASVIPIMNRMNLPSTLRTTVEAESAFNDVVSAVLMGVATAYIGRSGQSHAWIGLTLHALAGVALAIMIGGLAGVLGAYLVTKMAKGQPFVVYIAFPGVIWGLSHVLAFSIYLAAFIAGLTWRHRSHASPDEQWIASVGVIARVMIFVGLGMAFPIEAIRQWGLVGLGLALILIFGSRPLAVVGALGWLRRWQPNQLALMMWVRESGVISAALAARAAAQFPRWSTEILATVFVAIIVTVAVQAPTTPWIAKHLHVQELPIFHEPT